MNLIIHQKIIFNGDWTEKTPLGKAEWIKFFGALYDLDEKASEIFNSIEKEYNSVLTLAKNTKTNKIFISFKITLFFCDLNERIIK